ncbi:MAG: hypothetical protein M5R37_01455 [Melioribacteraceae bacterium]|nr:hypothetical protein [Melioribacteraceae bacterium]
MKRYFIVVLGLLIILSLFALRLICLSDFYSDSILSVTALIVLWYTFETAEIRKSENTIAKITEENHRRIKHPSVFCNIGTNPADSLDTRVTLSNLSNYPVAVKLNCNIKIGSSIIDFSQAYNGKHYWNLQINESKEGHFNLFDLFKNKDLISQEEFEDIRKESVPKRQERALWLFKEFSKSSTNKLTMDVEIYCVNEFNLATYYPSTHYDYDFERKVWIPILTSMKPYWEYDSYPKWIE